MKKTAFSIEQSPVDTEEESTASHRVVGRDKRIVVARQQHHIAVWHKDIGFFYFDGQSEVNEGVVADFNVVLEVEYACGGHVGIGEVFGEIAYRQDGL